MEREEIVERLTDVFRKILGVPELVLTDDLTAASVPQWDSLNHVNLVVGVEEAFRVRFTTREIRTLQNVGELVKLIERKRSTEAG